MFLRPGGRDIFTPQSFSFYIWTRKAAAHLMHILALGLTSLMALLATSSSGDSTKSLTTSWSSPRSRGFTLRISWSEEVVTRGLVRATRRPCDLRVARDHLRAELLPDPLEREITGVARLRLWGMIEE